MLLAVEADLPARVWNGVQIQPLALAHHHYPQALERARYTDVGPPLGMEDPQHLDLVRREVPPDVPYMQTTEAPIGVQIIVCCERGDGYGTTGTSGLGDRMIGS